MHSIQKEVRGQWEEKQAKAVQDREREEASRKREILRQ
eukprot:CAMPEP_0202967056 /NCGR_PEP_ID=MMETSP1396-20130829/11790_1 /ASSEMBLY_ACC=CAM_ASM_000872 /TAXON_ID= /ORGANISM="Pseudokeronopsis sp., Strain Brazil" /LENGTH=37 /DNA_ID= /DNA_START= /DNA_END= /DNA_ORIENTATION=